MAAPTLITRPIIVLSRKEGRSPRRVGIIP
jgi:hypothetical protein